MRTFLGSNFDHNKVIALLDKKVKERFPTIKCIFFEAESREHFLLQDEAQYQAEK